MTLGFNMLQIGDTVELKVLLGPLYGTVATWRGQTRRLKEIGFVCGGSGAYLLSIGA
jgi:nitrate reductase (NAD(P)H)